MLIVFSLLVGCFFFVISSLIFIFKGTSECITKAKLTLPDYMFTIMYSINNFKHLPLLFYGVIAVNPRPKRSSNIKFCHWNLNSLAAYHFIKVPLVDKYVCLKLV